MIVQFEGKQKRIQEGLPTHGFLCASIGDCKAYHWSKKTREVIEITAGNRGNTTDASDCNLLFCFSFTSDCFFMFKFKGGGRLGPATPESEPDLRNLDLYFQPCDIGDFVFIVSDGVHDNFDCQSLGKLPKDFNLPYETWDQGCQENVTPFVPYVLHSPKNTPNQQPQQILQLKSRYSCLLFEETIKKIISTQTLTPKAFADCVLNSCNQTTLSSREFMQNYTDKRLPNDYLLFPGKMDHTTIVCAEVSKEYKKN